jgi:hypothetical protein
MVKIDERRDLVVRKEQQVEEDRDARAGGLTVKLRTARSWQRQAKPLYPKHRHAARLTEADRARPPTIVR